MSCACPQGPDSIQTCQADFTFGACQCSLDADTNPSDVESDGPSVQDETSTPGPSQPAAVPTAPVAEPADPSSSSNGSEADPDTRQDGLIDYQYGDTAPCDSQENGLFFSGDSGDWVHPGQDFITVARFTDSSDADHIGFYIEPSGEEHGLWWDLDFSSEQLDEALKVGEYLDVERYPFETYLKPGLDVGGDGRGCNSLSGKFLITDLLWLGGTLVRFSASFEQHCEQGSSKLLGCIHYDSGLSPEALDAGSERSDASADAGAPNGESATSSLVSATVDAEGRLDAGTTASAAP